MEDSNNVELSDKKIFFLIKDSYNGKLKEISLQDAEGLIEQGRKEINDKIKLIIKELEKEQEFIRIKLYKAVDMLSDKEISINSDKIYINYMIRKYLQSLLDEEV